MTIPPVLPIPDTAPARCRTAGWWYLGFLTMLLFQPTFDPSSGAFAWVVTGLTTAAALGLAAALPMPFGLVAVAVPIVFVWVVGFATLEEVDRDLHDLTGHSLTSIIVRTQLIGRLVKRAPVRAAAEVDEVERTARAALTEIRETVRGWRQVPLDDELEAARHALAAAGVTLTIEREADLHLAPSVEQAFGLAIREGVTNVIRHADARRCTVRLGHRDDDLVLEVADDGASGRGPDGNGLLGMGKRMAALGGRVERVADGGTHLTVAVPAPGGGMIPPPVHVVLAEDQGMVLGAFASLLELEPDVEVVATATDGGAPLAAVTKHDPDVLLTDIEMPRRTGLDVAAERHRQGARTRVVIVTTFARCGYLRRAREVGVRGYVLKDAPIDDLVATVRRVHAGERVIDPELAIAAWDEADPLTDRERDILRLAGRGETNARIATRLHLADGTVRNYLSSAITKLHAANRTEAARLAHDRGWL